MFSEAVTLQSQVAERARSGEACLATTGLACDLPMPLPLDTEGLPRSTTFFLTNALGCDINPRLCFLRSNISYESEVTGGALLYIVQRAL